MFPSCLLTPRKDWPALWFEWRMSIKSVHSRRNMKTLWIILRKPASNVWRSLRCRQGTKTGPNAIMIYCDIQRLVATLERSARFANSLIMTTSSLIAYTGVCLAVARTNWISFVGASYIRDWFAALPPERPYFIDGNIGNLLWLSQ